jgi:glycosyltransferase involved in cell wall biosynthesis
VEQKRVLHLITTADLGGAEKQLSILTKLQIKSGFQVHVFSLKGKDTLKGEFEKNGSIFVSLCHLNWVEKITFVRRYVKDKRIKVLHAHLPRAELVGILALWRCHNTKNVITRHNLEPFFPKFPAAGRILSRIVCDRVNSVICISRAIEKYIIERREIRKRDIVKLHVVYYAHSGPSSLSIVKSKRGRSLGSDTFKIGTIARLTYQKNIEVLIKACASIPKNFNWHLSIVGIGNKRQLLESLSLKLGVSERVHFHGTVIDTGIFLETLDVFVLPSRYEGFGLVLLEAMQAKKCIVASDAPAIPEVLGYDYELLFKSNDYLDLQKQLLRSMSAKVRERTNQRNSKRLFEFDPAILSSKTSKIYCGVGEVK